MQMHRGDCRCARSRPMPCPPGPCRSTSTPSARISRPDVSDLGGVVADLSGVTDICANASPRSAGREGVGGGWLNGRVDLPVMPPVEPMLARSVPEIPVAEALRTRPRWTGFGCRIFGAGEEGELASGAGRRLTRYFPEGVARAAAHLPGRWWLTC